LSILRGALALAVVLGLQTLVGRLAPSFEAIGDLMLLPVAWYGIHRSQRSAMIVGCVGGLLQDAWFQVGVFGMSGFRKTLLGWVLGGIGSRLDLNHLPGRFATGVALSLGDRLLEIGLYRLLDLETAAVSIIEVLVRAVIVGALVALAFPLMDRFSNRRELRLRTGIGV
jgi:rod shape-determining protein MreD